MRRDKATCPVVPSVLVNPASARPVPRGTAGWPGRTDACTPATDSSKNKYGRIYRDAGADRPRAGRGRPGGEHAQGCPVPREPETSHPRANRVSRRRKRASPGIYTYLANFDILIMLESKRRT